MVETGQHTEELAEFPMRRTCPFDPPAPYATMRAGGGATKVRLPSGQAAWVLTRMADIRAVLTDRRFSSDRLRPGFPFLVKAPLSGPRTFKPSVVNMDPPEHTRVRRQVAGEYTPRRVARLRPRIQDIVDELVDALLAGPKPADLVRGLALAVPTRVICEQLGVPYSGHDFFQRHGRALLCRDTTRERRQAAADALQGYLRDLVHAKAADPGDDLLSRQVRGQREAGEAVDVDALVSLAVLLVVAGHETLANMISLGTLFLLEHPEHLAVIQDDPSAVPAAVEELLRYLTVAEVATARIAVEDVALADVVVRAGEGVIGLCHAGNRDPAAFASPDVFDIGSATRHHLAFGFGPHQCLGLHLARLELEVVFGTLFRRIPGLRLATPADKLPFKHDASVFGPHELPVTW